MADQLDRLKAALADRYRIESELGSGGMATVYLAQDLRHDRQVALKVMRPDLAASLGTDRFLREIKIVAGLNHPHILPLHDSGEAGGFLFYVMPYAEGESLRDRLVREKQLAIDDSLKIASEVADALGFAHEHNVIHRDIKPENILLESKHAVVTDFGVARAVEEAGGARLTETGIAVGTPSYMSPEQASGEVELDGRSDLYGLGCVLYEMLAGEPPFTGPTAEHIIRKHISAEPTPVNVVRPTVPDQIAVTVQRALAKSPADRFTTAEEFAAALTAPVASGRMGRRRVIAGTAGLMALLAVGAWWLVSGGTEDSSRPIERLAVLPLANLTGDSGQAYFVEGMHDALVAELAQIGDLTVIGRQSVLQYRETEKSVPEIARELGVDAVVEGSVFGVGETVRITAQLLRAFPEEQHLWTDSYEKDLRDVLGLHSEVARAIAAEIDVTLTGAEQARLARDRVVNPEAYELFLRGEHFLRQYSAASARRAIEYFQQATDEDPGFAPAYAGLAESYGVLPLWGGARAVEVLPEWKAAAVKAIELDPLLPKAHLVAAVISFFDWDWATADRQFQRALELEPNGAALHDNYGYYLECMGRFDEAVAHRQRAVELDPFNPRTNLFLSLAYWRARRYEEAIEVSKNALDLYPDHYQAHYHLSVAYALKGVRAEAVRYADTALALSPSLDDPALLGLVGWVYGVTGRRSQASELLGRFDHLATQTYVDPFWRTFVLVGLNDRAGAIESLTRAVTQRSPGVVDLMVEPMWDPLREDPRFQELLRRMDLPP